MKKMISVAKDFSPFAAGRYVTDGPFSGERFRTEVLVPELRANESVTVDLDGTLGLGSSFLDEAFGGLVRVAGFSVAELRDKLKVKCKLASYEQLTWRYIQEEEKRLKKR